MRHLNVAFTLTLAGLCVSSLSVSTAFAAGGDLPDKDKDKDKESSYVKPAAESPRNALSLQLMALASSGITLQYERFIGPPRRISLVTSIGARRSGGDDYSVFETAMGGEVRFWLEGKMAGYRFDGPAMVGPYLGLGVDFGMTRLTQDGHQLGTSMRVAEGLSFGIRFAPAHRLEITPSIGTGLRTEWGPHGLAPWTRFEVVRLGLTIGVLF